MVDDKPDTLESVEKILDMCIMTLAGNYSTVLQYPADCTYDLEMRI